MKNKELISLLLFCVFMIGSGGVASKIARASEDHAKPTCRMLLGNSFVSINGKAVLETQMITEANYPNWQVQPLISGLAGDEHCARILNAARNGAGEDQDHDVMALLAVDDNVSIKTMRLVLDTLGIVGFKTVGLTFDDFDRPVTIFDVSPQKVGSNMATAMEGTPSTPVQSGSVLFFHGATAGEHPARPSRSEPLMNIGYTSAYGNCSQEKVVAVIKQRAGALRACYENRLTEVPGLAGSVVISFRINYEGKAEDVTIDSTSLNNPTVENCLATIIRRMRFIASDSDGCLVKQNLGFTPADP